MASCGRHLSSGIVFPICQRRPVIIKFRQPINVVFSKSYASSGKRGTERLLLFSLNRPFQERCACSFQRFQFRLFSGSGAGSKKTTDAEKTDPSIDQAPSQQSKTKKPADRIVRVTPAPKASQTIATAQSVTSVAEAPIIYTKYVGAVKAKSEYCLTDEHLKDLRGIVRRSGTLGSPPILMYNRPDVLAKALSVHGNEEALEAARTRARTLEFVNQDQSLTKQPFFSLLPPTFLRGDDEKEKKDSSSSTAGKRKGIGSAAWKQQGTERVVLAAVAVNLGSLLVKLGAWWYTGSHSLMAESLHSLADTINQLLVAYGVHQSLRKPDKMHPYGYSNVRYLTSLISGIGIFYVGSAMSVYHGIRGLFVSAPLESLPIGLLVLTVAFCGDGLTFLMARRTVMAKAAAAGMTSSHYIRTGEDPSLSVVYLEDRAALYGVGVAIASLSASFYLNSPIPDAIGSVCIGLVLFQVAYKIIGMNFDQLLGKSIPVKEIDQITQQLEADPVVRSIQDIKATELGSGEIRFKAEIDFDGKSITRTYLKSIDLQKALEEAQSLKTHAELEQFLIKHGDGITDCQGAEIDRIEQALKKKFPDLRHVDLEAL